MTVAAYDVVIIGAGIVGAACALEAARAGMSVAVVEAGAVGGGATAAAMGHVVVMDDSEAQFALTRYSQTLWDELADELPPDVEYQTRGTIWIAADDEEMAEVRRKEKFYTARGVKVEMLSADDLAEAEPNLRKGLMGGLRVPGDSVINPPLAARFFVEQARQRGADVRLNQKIDEVTGEGVRLSDGSLISAGFVVNSAGSWSPSLSPGINVQKRKGHLVLTESYPEFVHHQLVELGYLKSAHSLAVDSVAFNVQPKASGQLLIGSSRQYGAEDLEIETPILTRMLERAFAYMPALRQLSVLRSWTGLRAATPDKLPLIGPSAEGSKFYLATGHEGLGITTSLGTAKLVVDQLLGRTPVIPVEPYLPYRTTQKETDR